MKSYKVNTIPYSPEQIRHMIETNPNRLFVEIEENEWMKIEHLKSISLDGTEVIFLLRNFYNRSKPKKRIDTTGQLKLL